MSEAHTLTRYLREEALKRLGLPADHREPTDDTAYAEAWRSGALEYIAKLENAANFIFTNTDEACECCNNKEELVATLKANYEILDKAIR
jgi:hypothetical protein